MGRVRSNVRLPLAAAVLLASGMIGIFAFTGPAEAAAVLMVSPSTGLTNGQSVTVTATGYPATLPGAVLECNNDTSQPTVSALGNQIPVSCTNPLSNLHETDASGNLTASFAVATGTVGPPATGTDSGGGDAATDAANYPCPPTSAQVTAGVSCVVAFGTSDGTQLTQPITFSGQTGSTTTTTSGGSTTTTTSSGSTTTTASTTTTTTSSTTTTTVPCNAKSTTSTGSGPTLTANPGTCLNGGSVVTVTGSGFTPKGAGAVLECNDTAGQPTVALGAPISQSVPVGCSGVAATALVQTDSSGNLSTKFTIIAGTVGPPCGAADLVKCPATDSVRPSVATAKAGVAPATDAANYPCPPTAAQIAAGATCQLAFGDSGGKQQTVNILFVPAPTASTTPTTAASVSSSSGAAASSSGSTTATTTPTTSASTLAFTGAGPGIWFTLLGGLLLLDLGYLVITTFYRPREFAVRTAQTIRMMFGGK